MSGYNLGVDGIEGEIGGGTNILLLGPPLSGKDVLAKKFFNEAVSEDGAGIYVSTTDNAKSLLEWFKKKDLDINEASDSFGIVDCVTKSQDLERPENEDCIEYASSPVDLTDIGVKISNFLKKFYKVNDKEKVRLVIDTVSVMIMYTDVKTIFRFLHTFSGRIRSVNGVDLFVIEEGSHDEKTIQTLKQLMDASLETKKTNNDKKLRYNGRGFSFDWKEYEVINEDIELKNK